VSCNSGYADCDGSTASGCERQLSAQSNTCSSALYLGATSGDSACGFLCPGSSYVTFATRTGFTSQWFSVRVLENSNCIADLHARITLAVPAGLDYDLFVYSACGTLIASSIGGAGATEQLVITKADSIGGDDAFDIWIEVRYFSGSVSCGTWTLTVDGTNC
jgi:hypothetical protein